MSTNVGSIHYDLDLDTSKFDRAAQNIKSKTQAIGDKMSSVGKTMTVGLTLPIVAGAALAVKAASDLNENINKVGVAFKKSSKDVMAWSKTSIKAMGLAQSSALEAASLFGDMATSMGLPTEKAAKMSMNLVQLGADLASFKNISFQEAQTALAGVFTGETESLKRLGIVMTETNLLEYAKAQGIKKTIQEMSQGEKVQLRYEYIMSKTANAQGDFIRTGGGTANQIRITQEKFKELSATLGAQLLPIANKVLGWIQKLMDKVSALTPKQQDWLLVTLAITAAIGPLLVVLGNLVKAFGALLPLLANPVFLVIAVIMAVIAGAAYLIWKNWDKIAPVVQKVGAAFAGVAAWIRMDVLPALKTIWLVIKDQLMAAWRDLQAAAKQFMEVIKPYIPELKMLAQIIVVAVVSALVVLVAAIAGAIVVVARLVGWVAKALVAYAQFSAGVRQASINMANITVGRINAIIGFIQSLPQRARNAVGNLRGVLYGAGRSLIQGFINGVRDMWGSMIGTVENAANSVKNKFKSILGIHSPSKVFANYGKNITQGLVNGITAGRKAMDSSISKLGNATISPVLRTTGVGNNNGPGTTNITIGNVYDRSDADYILRRIDNNQTVQSFGIAPAQGAHAL